MRQLIAPFVNLWIAFTWALTMIYAFATTPRASDNEETFAWKPKTKIRLFSDVEDDDDGEQKKKKNKLPRVVKKRVTFIRHGQSITNQMAKKEPSFIASVLCNGVKTAFTAPNDSAFIDPHLTDRGVKDAVAFRRRAFPEGPEDMELQVQACSTIKPTIVDFVGHHGQGKAESSVVICSNLRRAMATTLIGLEPRLRQTQERVIQDAILQETTWAPALAMNGEPLSARKGFSLLSAEGKATTQWTKEEIDSIFDPSLNCGNQNGYALERVDEFAARVFGQGSHDFLPCSSLSPSDRSFFARFLPQLHHSLPAAPKSTLQTATSHKKKETEKKIGYYTPDGELAENLTVVGHGLFFRLFMRRYLEAAKEGSSIVEKQRLQRYKENMHNCDWISFELVSSSEVRDGEVFIDPKSLSFGSPTRNIYEN